MGDQGVKGGVVEELPTASMWAPSKEQVSESQMTSFRLQVNAKRGLQLASYPELHAWSIAHIDHFWSDVWDFCNVVSSDFSH